MKPLNEKHYRDGYLIPGSKDALRNRLGLTNKADIEGAVSYHASQQEAIPFTKFAVSYKGFRGLHRHLYNDSYEWAGVDRSEYTVLSDKWVQNDSFQPVLALSKEIGKQIYEFKKSDQIKHDCARYCMELRDDLYQSSKSGQINEEDLAKHLSVFAAKMNWAHPFRDGNARTIKNFIAYTAEESGYSLDFEYDMGKWELTRYQASHENTEKSIIAAAEPLADLIKENLEPLDRRASGKSKEEIEPSNKRVSAVFAEKEQQAEQELKEQPKDIIANENKVEKSRALEKDTNIIQIADDMKGHIDKTRSFKNELEKRVEEYAAQNPDHEPNIIKGAVYSVFNSLNDTSMYDYQQFVFNQPQDQPLQKLAPAEPKFPEEWDMGLVKDSIIDHAHVYAAAKILDMQSQHMKQALNPPDPFDIKMVELKVRHYKDLEQELDKRLDARLSQKPEIDRHALDQIRMDYIDRTVENPEKIKDFIDPMEFQKARIPKEPAQDQIQSIDAPNKPILPSHDIVINKGDKDRGR